MSRASNIICKIDEATMAHPDIMTDAARAAIDLKMKDMNSAIACVTEYMAQSEGTFKQFVRRLTEAADMNGIPTSVVNQLLRHARFGAPVGHFGLLEGENGSR